MKSYLRGSGQCVGLALFFTVFVMGITGCGARDRINPFDPSASGDSSVFNLKLRSDPNSVFLQWNPVNSPDLSEYNIYRAVVPHSLELLTRVPGAVHAFHDTINISPGATYVYGVSAVGQINETQISHLDTITPGNSWWWVASGNVNNAPLSRLSHDGLHVYQSYDYYESPRFLAADWDAPVIFVYNSSQGEVYMQWSEDNIQVLATDIYSVRDMVYDGPGRILLFIPEHDNKITLVTIPYGIVQEYKITEQAPANAVAVSPTGTPWIAAGDSLFRFLAGRLHFYYTTHGSSITAIEPIQDNEVMISLETAQTVQRIVPEPGTPEKGQLDTSLTNVGYVKEMVYDPENTILWLRSYNTAPRKYEILQYTTSGIRKVLTGGDSMLSMAINPISHDCLTADYGTGWLYRISPTGAVKKKMSPVGPIYEIVVQPISDN